MSRIVRLVLPDAEFAVLRDLASANRRDPRAQAQVILERAVKRARTASQETRS